MNVARVSIAIFSFFCQKDGLLRNRIRRQLLTLAQQAACQAQPLPSVVSLRRQNRSGPAERGVSNVPGDARIQQLSRFLPTLPVAGMHRFCDKLNWQNRAE